VGFVVEKVALGQVLSEYFIFRCKFAFHLLLHNHHHLSSGSGTIGQIVAAAVLSGLSLTLMRKIKRIIKIIPVCLSNVSFYLQGCVET
jgi:hypothetical protein